ncbi:MAG: DUF3301 domain-containing protein [Thiolinea sp.]
MNSLIFLGLLGVLAWFWQDSLRSRERAIQAAAQACREMGAQLLDQTVSLESLKPARTARGRLILRRIYGFDFSIAGYERRRGRAFMLGRKLEQLQIDTEGGTTIELQEG